MFESQKQSFVRDLSPCPRLLPPRGVTILDSPKVTEPQGPVGALSPLRGAELTSAELQVRGQRWRLSVGVKQSLLK